jgi:hypothetical protein
VREEEGSKAVLLAQRMEPGCGSGGGLRRVSSAELSGNGYGSGVHLGCVGKRELSEASE